jgi:hypothetical protein
MRKILSATAFNMILNEVIHGGAPRPDGRPGCMIAIRPGANMVPDELIEHHYLKSYIDADLVTLPDANEPEPPPRTISKFNRTQSIEPPPLEPIGADPAIEPL